MVSEVRHECPCGYRFIIYYEDGATIDPTCPQCGRRNGLQNVGTHNAPRLAETISTTLVRSQLGIEALR